MTELNATNLEAYQKGLNDLGLFKEEWRKKQADLQNKNFELLQNIDNLSDELGQNKEKFKELAVEEYSKTGNKKLIGGLGIREGVALKYDETTALGWAEDHKLCLQLDKKEFEKIAKTQDIDFVDKEKKITVTFPKEIKIA